MYIVSYFNNRRETSKNDARYPIVYAAKSPLDPDGPSLAQQFLTDDKCEEQNNCADDNKRYSVHQKEGDKPGEAFLM